MYWRIVLFRKSRTFLKCFPKNKYKVKATIFLRYIRCIQRGNSMRRVRYTKVKEGFTIAALILILASTLLLSVSAIPTVGTNVNITNESHGQDEPSIAINPLHNTFQPMDLHVAVGANDYSGMYSQLGLWTSTDLTSWTYHSVMAPSYDAAGNPVLAYDNAGNLYYAYMAFDVDFSGNPLNAAIYVSKSTDEGATWAFYTRVSNIGVGNNPYNDRPWIAIDQSNNYIYVTWTVWYGRGASCVGSDIMFARSTDGGVTFSSPMLISSSYSPSGQQRQWTKIAIDPSGQIYVTWRRFGGGPGITRAIFMAKSTDNGASFGPEVMVLEYPDFDGGDYTNDYAAPATCTWPQLAAGPEGNLYLAWHRYIADWDRDLNFIRSTDGGASWSSVMTVASTTSDQFWPTLAVAPSGRLDLVWYDRRDDPSNRLLNLYYTSSSDQGVTFDTSITKVTTATSSTSVPVTGSVLYFGDYIQLVETSDGAALPVWTDTRVGNQEIFIAPITHEAAPQVPTIESCDSTGATKDTFDLMEDVYVIGNGYSPSTTYDLYVVMDEAVWSDGMTIPTRVSGTATSVSSDAGGNVPTTLAWTHPLVLGKYDIAVDVNGNGIYDAEVDALDDSDVVVTAGFFVIPEVPLGTIVISASMIIALATYLALPRLRRKSEYIKP
jgi:hypothetical protein